LAKFFSVGKNTTEYQVTETVRLIRSEYFYLKPEDFRLCFDWLRLGKYGRMYDRFDGAIILEALIKYTDERAMEAEKVVRLKQKEDASNLYQIFDSPVLKPVLDKVHKEVTDKLVMKEQEPRRPQMNDVDLYIENLWAKRAMNSRTIGGVTFIQYKGREMAREEFLKLKYQQFKNISQKLL